MPRYNKFSNNKRDFKKERSHYRTGKNTPEDFEVEDVAPKDMEAVSDRPRDYSPGFEKKTYKDLVFGQVTLKVNPSVEAGELADPYAITGSSCRVIDAKYRGQDNESGSICPQLAFGTASTMVDMPDFISTEVEVNYNYAKHTSSDNADSSVNKAYFYPWAEIMSSIQAEAFYDLPFFKWYVDSSESTTYYEDPLLDVLDFYQVVLQSIYQIPLRYKVVRSLEKEIKDMCYHQGSSVTNDLYGRLKKAAFIGTINGLSEGLSAHWLDTKWLEETALLLAQPSKKAIGMLDPLMEVKVKYSYNNNLKVYSGSDKAVTVLDTSSNDYASMFTAINAVLDALSIGTVLELSRTNANQTAILRWFNDMVSNIALINNSLVSFTRDFADLLVAFKRMSKAGFTNWKIGQFLLIDDINEKFKPSFNKMVFDIIRSTHTGGRDIAYDSTINQWKGITLWDKFLGIPTYDSKSGGSVLTFSVRQRTGTIPTGIMAPVWFKPTSTVLLTRLGNKYPVTTVETRVDSSAIARILGRLVPTSAYATTLFKVPSVDLSALSSNPIQQSWVTEALEHVFGYLRVAVSSGTYNYVISDDILTSVDFVLNDVSNSVDTMARINAPFRVLKSTKEETLGISRL